MRPYSSSRFSLGFNVQRSTFNCCLLCFKKTTYFRAVTLLCLSKIVAQPSNTNTDPVPLKSYDGIPPIEGSERYIRTVPRRVDDPLSLEIDSGSLVIIPNRTIVSPSGGDSAPSQPSTISPSQNRANTEPHTRTHLVIVKSIKNTDNESRPGEKEVVGHIIATLGRGTRYPSPDKKTILDGIEVPSNETWIPVSLPSPHPLPAWTYGPPLRDFINSVHSWIQVAPITFQIYPSTIYRTIMFNSTCNAEVFATPRDLRQLTSYETALKDSALEVSSTTAVARPGGGLPGRSAWDAGPSSGIEGGSKREGGGGHRGGASDPEGSRQGPTGGPTAGSEGTQRPSFMDDDDGESWNSGSYFSDGEGEMAFLAANFGGIFVEMQEQAQETKKLQRNEMVQHWRL